MRKLRKILYPISLLYAAVTKMRNTLYDTGVLSSKTFDVPIITVGNLRVGGTGKTPQIAYLVDLLRNEYQVAVLSRGYKRKSKGFVLAKQGISPLDLGDEPYQLYRRYPDIIVAVDADRERGIDKLLSLDNPPQVILLDDAMQHRKVQAGLTLLLTPFDDLYSEDSHLPTGNLRESIEGANRAQVVVVTKCPALLTEQESFDIAVKLKIDLTQTLFFSRIKYASYIQNEKESIAVNDLGNYKILLVTGIANPKPLLLFLDAQKYHYKHLEFPDHHNFSKKDMVMIEKTFQDIGDKNKLLLTTEKDYVRIFVGLENVYYLAIETEFINHQKDFDTIILDYVGKNSGNRKIS